MAEFTMASIDRIMRHAGATRINVEATEMLLKITERISYRIAQKALELCKNRNKKTLTPDDIKKAYFLLLEECLPYFNL